MQTLWAILSLICRVALFGLAVPVLLGDFPGFHFPYNPSQEWWILTGCDALAVLMPVLRSRKLAFLAGVAALSSHYYYHRHSVPVWDLAYMAVAIVLLLVPSSGRVAKRKPTR